MDPKTVLWNDGTQEVKVRNRDGASYVEPAIAANKRVLDQGFALRVQSGGKEWIKELREEDWEDVSFESSYPVATIRFRQKGFPVAVEMKAGAIFIPLDADNSALPATVFDITIKNETAAPVTVTIAGWLENGGRKVSGKDGEGERRNTIKQTAQFTGVFSTFEAKAGGERRADDGSTAIGLIGRKGIVQTDAKPWPVDAKFFTTRNDAPATSAPSGKLLGSVATEAQTLAPGKSSNAQYVLSWHINQPLAKLGGKMKDIAGGFFYAERFADAGAVGAYAAEHFKDMWGKTLLWTSTGTTAHFPIGSWTAPSSISAPSPLQIPTVSPAGGSGAGKALTPAKVPVRTFGSMHRR